jgi:hypothetical protein
MDAQQLRDLVGGVVAQFRDDMAAMDAILAQYDLELLPPVPPTIPVTGTNLQTAINAAPDGATLDLLGAVFPQVITIAKPLTLINGGVVAPAANTDTLVTITGAGVALTDFTVTGDDATTKRGISAQGHGLTLTRVRVTNIGRPGTETQALACWNGSHIVADDCTFYAGSIAILFGGNGTAVQNHVPSDCSFTNCIMGRPLSWKTRFGCKTIFEVKNGRNITVSNSLLENNWEEGPQGHAITITPSNYDNNSPLTIAENIEFSNCQILNVNGGAKAIGYSQHHYGTTSTPASPTLRGNNYRFLNNTFVISKAVNGGQGALLTTQCEPLNILFEGNTHTSDGDALMRVNDARIGNGVLFRNNVRLNPGTYGVFSSAANRGAGFHTQFPPSAEQPSGFTGNTMAQPYHSIFRANFPDNLYQ